MRVCFIAIVMLLGALASCGANANIRHLPIASAIVVHSCAAAEADTYIRGEKGGDYAVSEVTITLKASGENKGTASVKDYLGIEAVRDTEKSAELKLTRLPTMEQCKSWGYAPQLGVNGCLYGTTNCNATATTLPKDVPRPIDKPHKEQ